MTTTHQYIPQYCPSTHIIDYLSIHIWISYLFLTRMMSSEHAYKDRSPTIILKTTCTSTQIIVNLSISYHVLSIYPFMDFIFIINKKSSEHASKVRSSTTFLKTTSTQIIDYQYISYHVLSIYPFSSLSSARSPQSILQKTGYRPSYSRLHPSRSYHVLPIYPFMDFIFIFNTTVDVLRACFKRQVTNSLSQD